MGFDSRTEVFDVDCALLAKAGGGDGEVFAVGNKGAIASFGNSQTVNRRVRFKGDLFVEVGSRATGWEGNFFWELFDWLPYLIVSTPDRNEE